MSLNFILLAGLLAVLAIAGGASRIDVPAEALVLGSAWFCIVVSLLCGTAPSWRGAAPVAIILLACVLLVGLQLIPLPPAIWQALPGRGSYVEVAGLIREPQPWRPLAIVPELALHSLQSLAVPLAVLLLALGVTQKERAWLPALLLVIMVTVTTLGMLQFLGAGISNPLINDAPGEVSGSFANRNHFALFMALGCLIAPFWAFQGGRRPGWRSGAVIALVLLFVIMILASGSRAGLLLGLVALFGGFLLARHGIRRELRGTPRWVFAAIIAALVGVVAALILASVFADRAVSINRALAMQVGDDMRTRGLPVVLEMIGTYFPAGSGFGGFDPIFRMHEPFRLLKPTYFNHAHNDFLEVALAGGLPGMLLLFGGVGWWAWASLRAWRAGLSRHHALPRLGSAMLLLVMLASIVDYPARTPIIMAVVVIAAIWLSGHSQEVDAPALPRSPKHL